MLRHARGLLDEYEALWRGRIDRMTDLIAASRGNRHMTITAVHKDPAALTMKLVAKIDASPERDLGAVGRSAPARALVGPTHLPGHVHSATTLRPAAASSTT